MLINAVAAIIVMRFFWPAVLMLFAFAGVNLGLSLENERAAFATSSTTCGASIGWDETAGWPVIRPHDGEGA